MSTASRNGPFEPGPNAVAELVVRDALGAGLGLVAVVGLAEAQLRDRRGEDEQEHDAAGDGHPRPRGDLRGPSGRRTGDGCTCSGFFGRSHFWKAPIMIGRIVSAEIDDRADADRGREPELADERDADASRPAIATITITPAATTEAPDGRGGLRRGVARACRPLATCSR